MIFAMLVYMVGQ